MPYKTKKPKVFESLFQAEREALKTGGVIKLIVVGKAKPVGYQVITKQKKYWK